MVMGNYSTENVSIDDEMIEAIDFMVERVSMINNNNNNYNF